MVISSDIEKAFLQISIKDEDRDAIRFLWYDDPYKEDGKLVTYRFTRVAFGIISSPAQLNTVVKFHLDKYDLPICRKMELGMYVDNIFVGLNDSAEFEECTNSRRKSSQKLG